MKGSQIPKEIDEEERHEIELNNYNFNRNFNVQNTGNALEFVIDSNMPSSGRQSDFYDAMRSEGKEFTSGVSKERNDSLTGNKVSEAFDFEWKKSKEKYEGN